MTDLYGDDAMALSLFRKAADAIVAKSELSNALQQVKDQLSRLEVKANYAEYERNNASASLDIARQQIDQLMEKVAEQKDLAADQARQIISLTDENAALDESLGKAMMERDEARTEASKWMSEYEEADTFRKTAEDKLRTIQQALGNGVPEVAPVVETFPPVPEMGQSQSTDVRPEGTEKPLVGISEGMVATYHYQLPQTQDNTQGTDAPVSDNLPHTFSTADSEDADWLNSY